MGIYETNIELVNMSGEKERISSYKGKVLLIVNTASKCGFTPQFKGLEEIYQKYKSKGFSVIGFPCNQFNNQDPGENADIMNFCQLNYGVSFPMFEKIEVNGDNRHPIYQYLIEYNLDNNTKDIKWNFEKFLISREGAVLKRYSSIKKPKGIESDIIKAL